MYSFLFINRIFLISRGILFVFFFQVSSVLVLGQGGTQKKQLVGTWQYQNTILKIMDNNQLVYDGETSNYSLISNAIRVYDDYGSYFDYVYTISQEKLSITFPDGNQYVFSKAKKMTGQGKTSGTIPAGLYGNFCNYSGSSGGSSSYSSTRSLYFDGKGHFIYGTETSFSGNAGNYLNNSDSSPSENGSYSVSGNTIILSANDGSTYQLKITIVQNSGEITEVVYNQMTFAKALCN